MAFSGPPLAQAPTDERDRELQEWATVAVLTDAQVGFLLWACIGSKDGSDVSIIVGALATIKLITRPSGAVLCLTLVNNRVNVTCMNPLRSCLVG
jgi:hypothetical protein